MLGLFWIWKHPHAFFLEPNTCYIHLRFTFVLGAIVHAILSFKKHNLSSHWRALPIFSLVSLYLLSCFTLSFLPHSWPHITHIPIDPMPQKQKYPFLGQGELSSWSVGFVCKRLRPILGLFQILHAPFRTPRNDLPASHRRKPGVTPEHSQIWPPKIKIKPTNSKIIFILSLPGSRTCWEIFNQRFDCEIHIRDAGINVLLTNVCFSASVAWWGRNIG